MLSKKSHRLNECLKEAGIRPISFAYFLKQFIKKKESKRKGATLLTASLKAQAELIVYHLEH